MIPLQRANIRYGVGRHQNILPTSNPIGATSWPFFSQEMQSFPLPYPEDRKSNSTVRVRTRGPGLSHCRLLEV